MKKTFLLLLVIVFLVCGCYQSWNGLNFKYTELNKSYESISDLKKLHGKTEFFALKYGTSFFPASSAYYQGKMNEFVPFNWLFYCIKNEDFIVLIDTGFEDEKYIKSFAVEFKNPIELLAEINIFPEDISHVIITHSHFDHIGTVHKYPNAEIIINEKSFNDLLNFPSLGYVREFLQESKNIKTFDRSTQILEGIRVFPVGGHAPGSSCISFKLNKTEYLITGDEAYTFQNIKDQLPVGTHVSLDRNRSFLKELEGFKGKIFTFHDPSIVPDTLGFVKIQ